MKMRQEKRRKRKRIFGSYELKQSTIKRERGVEKDHINEIGGFLEYCKFKQ